MTQPGESQSIEEIVRLYASGVQLQGFLPEYHDSDIAADMQHADIFEVMTMQQSFNQHVDDLTASVEAAKRKSADVVGDRPLSSDDSLPPNETPLE